MDEFLKAKYPWMDNTTKRDTIAIDKNKPLPIVWYVADWESGSIDAPYPTATNYRQLFITQFANGFPEVRYFAGDAKNNRIIEFIRA